MWGDWSILSRIVLRGNFLIIIGIFFLDYGFFGNISVVEEGSKVF